MNEIFVYSSVKSLHCKEQDGVKSLLCKELRPPYQN